MQEELCVCEQFVCEKYKMSFRHIILQMSSLKELTFRFWLTRTFWSQPMSLTGQKLEASLGMETYNTVGTFLAAMSGPYDFFQAWPRYN